SPVVFAFADLLFAACCVDFVFALWDEDFLVFACFDCVLGFCCCALVPGWVVDLALESSLVAGACAATPPADRAKPALSSAASRTCLFIIVSGTGNDKENYRPSEPNALSAKVRFGCRNAAYPRAFSPARGSPLRMGVFPGIIAPKNASARQTPACMNALPSGNVTFLFTDIEGSTRLIAQHPDAMKEALARHHSLLETAIEGHRGQVFQIVGDTFLSAFANPSDALSAALEAQRALHGQTWGEVGAVRVRMGLHTGAAEARDREYVSSLTLARVQRVASAGHGGQTLLSSAAAEGLAGQLPKGTTLRDLGPYKLRG